MMWITLSKLVELFHDAIEPLHLTSKGEEKSCTEELLLAVCGKQSLNYIPFEIHSDEEESSLN